MITRAADPIPTRCCCSCCCGWRSTSTETRRRNTTPTTRTPSIPRHVRCSPFINPVIKGTIRCRNRILPFASSSLLVAKGSPARAGPAPLLLVEPIERFAEDVIFFPVDVGSSHRIVLPITSRSLTHTVLLLLAIILFQDPLHASKLPPLLLQLPSHKRLLKLGRILKRMLFRVLQRPQVLLRFFLLELES
ncbi:hypothetical protein KC322_g39 [Hortaea werneckii]|nr:hypothetical protein KC322_g39 [Hortaea werneckii]